MLRALLPPCICRIELKLGWPNITSAAWKFSSLAEAGEEELRNDRTTRTRALVKTGEETFFNFRMIVVLNTLNPNHSNAGAVLMAGRVKD